MNETEGSTSSHPELIEEYLGLKTSGKEAEAKKLLQDMSPYDAGQATKRWEARKTPNVGSSGGNDTIALPKKAAGSPFTGMGIAGKPYARQELIDQEERIRSMSGRQLGPVPVTPAAAPSGGGSVGPGTGGSGGSSMTNPTPVSSGAAGGPDYAAGAKRAEGEMDAVGAANPLKQTRAVGNALDFLKNPEAAKSWGPALLNIAANLADAYGSAGREAYLGIESPTKYQQEYTMRLASQQQANQLWAAADAEIQKLEPELRKEIQALVAAGKIDEAKEVAVKNRIFPLEYALVQLQNLILYAKTQGAGYSAAGSPAAQALTDLTGPGAPQGK